MLYTHSAARQDLTGSAYDDLTQESSSSDVVGQAVTAADFNKQLTQQRHIRTNYLDEYWKRPHDAPPSPAQSSGGEHPVTGLPHQLHSPQQHGMSAAVAPHQMMGQSQAPHLLGQQAFPQQGAMMSQSPVRPMHTSLQPGQLPQGSPGMSMQTLGGRQQTPSYNYGAGGMWPPPQPQPSPHLMQAYSQQQQQQQQPMQSPMHPPSQRHPNNMNFHQMSNSAYGHMNRSMYQPQGSPQQQQHPQQQYGQQPQNMQAWAQQQQQQQQHPGGMSGQDWQRSYQ